MKILIAEDDPVSSRILATMLAKWGHEVVSTQNGAEAWQKLQQPDSPVMMILDWMMPEMDGLEVCRHVRQLPRRISPYIILLTANQGVDPLVMGMEAGADDYLTKPYNRDELRVRLNVGVRIIELQTRLAERVQELEVALDRVKQLEGILPICSYCKKVRDDNDYWQSVESYVSSHSEAHFSHGICPSCYDTTVKPQLESFMLSQRAEQP
jgi:sigma-B regulation protein RsbU (phosphoserine phosphatase)